jgi:hypothetical protein
MISEHASIVRKDRNGDPRAQRNDVFIVVVLGFPKKAAVVPRFRIDAETFLGGIDVIDAGATMDNAVSRFAK